MPTNVNPAVSPAIQPASRASETKTDKLSVNRDGGSASGFAKQTDVKFNTSVDNMSAVLEKLSSATINKDNVLPAQLRDMINNIVTKSFSLEGSLSQGLGSAMASERYTVEQLTALGRIFQQLGNAAGAEAAAASAAGEAAGGQLSDALQSLLANIKGLVAEASLGGREGGLELVQLTKQAFQMLNDGGSQGLPENMSKLLRQLSGQNVTSGNAPGGQEANALRQLLNTLFPQSLSRSSAAGSGMTAANQPGQANTATQTATRQGANIQQAAGQNPAGAGATANNGANIGQNISQAAMSAEGQAGAAGNNAGAQAQNAAVQGNMAGNAGNADSGQAGLNNAGANANANNPANTANNIGNTGNAAGNAGSTATEAAKLPNVANASGNATQGNTPVGANNPNSTAAGSQANAAGSRADNVQAQAGAQESSVDTVAQGQGRISAKVMRQAAELESNPLFRQIFSRYGYSQETGIVRTQVQQAVQQPQLANNQQTVDSFKGMAELLLKDSSLTAKDTALLQDFVNSSQTQLSQQDAKQLNLLLRLVQSNVPAAVQQAGQQPGMEGLPKLWAFLQLAELGTLKDIRAKDFKNARKEVKTLVSSLKSTISSEGSYKADGQKSISFVMPLYIGQEGQSYPAYINIYDEPEHQDERGRTRKDTWFRVCVLTENIGAVDIVCQLFEGSNLNLRINFSSQEAVQAFGEYLPDIRRALYDTSIHLNDLRVGTVN